MQGSPPSAPPARPLALTAVVCVVIATGSCGEIDNSLRFKCDCYEDGAKIRTSCVSSDICHIISELEGKSAAEIEAALRPRLDGCCEVAAKLERLRSQGANGDPIEDCGVTFFTPTLATAGMQCTARPPDAP